MSHTKEPWSIDQYWNINDASGHQIGLGGVVTHCTLGAGMQQDRANARRIVACVNACAGVGTETLELMAERDSEPLQASAERNLSHIADLQHQLAEAEAKLAEAQKDAERWRTARQYLSVEDIEAWRIEMKGHRPSEIENTKADVAIDAVKGGAHA